MEENTLVILTSDNGPWANYGNHAGSTGGLREAKATTFDGGNRVPCLVYWKGKTKAGSILNWVMPIVLVGLFLLATAFLVDGSYNPFLYFRF